MLKTCSGCNKPKPIWKNVVVEGGRKKFCKYCWGTHQNNSSIVKKTKQNKPSPLSLKRGKQLAEYAILMKDFKEKNTLCKAGIPNHCTNKATDIHHIAGRVGEKLNDTKDWIHICRGCHTWIHNNPKEARELNLLK